MFLKVAILLQLSLHLVIGIVPAYMATVWTGLIIIIAYGISRMEYHPATGGKVSLTLFAFMLVYLIIMGAVRMQMIYSSWMGWRYSELERWIASDQPELAGREAVGYLTQHVPTIAADQDREL